MSSFFSVNLLLNSATDYPILRKLKIKG